MSVSLWQMRRLPQRARLARQNQSGLLAVVMSSLSGISFAQENDPPFYAVKRLVPSSGGKSDDGLQQTIHDVRLSFLEQETERLEKCFAGKKGVIALWSKETEAGDYTRR